VLGGGEDLAPHDLAQHGVAERSRNRGRNKNIAAYYGPASKDEIGSQVAQNQMRHRGIGAKHHSAVAHGTRSSDPRRDIQLSPEDTIANHGRTFRHHKREDDQRYRKDVLGKQQALPAYLGATPEEEDMRLMAEDPRFRGRLHEGPERGVTDTVRAKLADKPATGFYDDGSRADKMAAARSYAKRKVVQNIPLVGTGVKAYSAYDHHKKKGAAREMQHDETSDDMTRAMAHGFKRDHASKVGERSGEAAFKLAKDGIRAATFGASVAAEGVMGAVGELAPSMPSPGGGFGHAVLDAVSQPKNAPRAGGLAHTAGRKLMADDPSEMRQAAFMPGLWAGHEGTDQANQNLLANFSGDAERGDLMMDYLSRPAQSTGFDDILSAAADADGRKGDHTLKPSQVQRIDRGEAARQRQIERMGPDKLEALRKNREKNIGD
jgi:hypothetical protein